MEDNTTKKKTLIILLLLFISCMASAQIPKDYEPFIVEGKVWHYEVVTYRGSEFISYDFIIYFSGDTIVEGKKSKFLFMGPQGQIQMTSACYEENGKVWMFYELKTKEHPEPYLIFDFSAEEGDFVKDWYTVRSDSLEVVNTTTITSFGRERKRLALKSSLHPQNAIGYWLEGVGSRYDMFDLWPSFAASVRLKSCELNGEIIADQSSFGDAALQLSGIQEITTSLSQPPALYDLHGRRVSGTPRRGIYICDGRKFLVK